MPVHILFLVHGVGLHSTAWAESADGPIETLRNASKRYAYFESRNFDDRVEVVPVHYDEVFRAVVEAWQSDANEVALLDPGGILSPVIGALAGASQEEFWWSHVADVAMYRSLPLYRQRVRAHVIRQIAERIERAWDEDGSALCSVVAHSLGTAVAHDCLHLLGTTRWGGANSPFNPRHWRFQHIFMLANTSRLLQTTDGGSAQAYTSIVRPGRVEDPDSYCSTYLNIRHVVDPIAFPRRFEPVGWRPQFSTMVVDHYRDANVHGFSHYLLSPRVHVPILRRLVRSTAVTPDEEAEAVNPDNFPQFEVTDVGTAQAHVQRLQQVIFSLGEDPSVGTLARGLLSLYELATEFRQ